MGSRARSTSTSETNSLALDASATNGEGNQILDSIIIDPSDTVMIETINQHRATFQTMMSENTIQLEGLLDLGTDVLRLADAQQVNMHAFAYQQLQTAMQFLEASKAEGKYVIDFAAQAVGQSFSLAGDVVNGNQDGLNKALDLVAQVKTSDAQQTVTTLALLVTVFGLGGMYLLTQKV